MTPLERLRRPVRKARTWLLWRVQGRPLNVPVVIRRGRLIACRHGQHVVTGWVFDTRYMADPKSVDADLLWRDLSERCEVELVVSTPHCRDCRLARVPSVKGWDQ